MGEQSSAARGCDWRRLQLSFSHTGLDRGVHALEASISAIVLVFVSLKVWTTRVILDDIGIRWAFWNESSELRWDQVSGLGFKREVSGGEGPGVGSTSGFWNREAGGSGSCR